MKKFAVLMISLVLVLSFTAGAHASKKGFGLGIVLGQPTGLSFKTFFDRNSALDVAATWDFSASAIGGHAQYLIHNYDLFDVKSGRLPFYFGVGGFAGFWSSGIYAGVQVPVGLAYEFSKEPIDIFLEARPGIAVIPATRMNVSGGLGIRFWFD